MDKKNFKSPATNFISEDTRQKVDQAQDPSGSAQPSDFMIPAGYKLTPETKSVRLQVLIQPTTKAAIKKLADTYRISVNELVNNALKDYIANSERKG